MCSIGKGLVRFAVLGAVVGGTALIVVGPHRMHALFSQTRDRINGCIDDNIDDPVALRQQLRDLESQYPEKIAAVRGDLAEVNEQIDQLRREQAISARVVSLADTDLSSMKDVLARAEGVRAESGAIVRVRFDNRSLPLDEAYAKANRVSQLRSAYATRSADIERDLGYLTQQQSRLGELLNQLETERAEFQTQLWALDRQVDAIARNERMIEMMQKRQATLDRYDDPYTASSLSQINGRLAEIRSEQESKLELLSQDSDSKRYETQARFELEDGQEIDDDEFELDPGTIEVSPEGAHRNPDVARIH